MRWNSSRERLCPRWVFVWRMHFDARSKVLCLIWFQRTSKIILSFLYCWKGAEKSLLYRFIWLVFLHAMMARLLVFSSAMGSVSFDFLRRWTLNNPSARWPYFLLWCGCITELHASSGWRVLFTIRNLSAYNHFSFFQGFADCPVSHHFNEISPAYMTLRSISMSMIMVPFKCLESPSM